MVLYVAAPRSQICRVRLLWLDMLLYIAVVKAKSLVRLFIKIV